ncbi:hypothetical protein DDW05_03095 [Candidatus Nanobsidianus stetteri]|uniref:Uncharacterized protein n=1 Tax=Nanobsidianus stetteri TaxID=1294122 RepID=A0A2T9WQF2_NANST|nr:hypothetical protein DDW05_03095 [Candidatus Nanobsidianus stetteri]
MAKIPNGFDPKIYFSMLQLSIASAKYKIEEELGTEFIKLIGEELIKYAKKSYKEYQKELRKAYKKLPKEDRETLDILLLKIDNAIEYKEPPLDPYAPLKWPLIYEYIHKTHFKTDIIKSINKHLEGLDPTQPNYSKEIKNMLNVLISLRKPEIYKLFAAYILKEDKALGNILNTPENSLIDNKMIEKIKRLRTSYIRTIRAYIQKKIEWADSTYQEASKYIEDTIEELFRKNKYGFAKKIASAFLEYS